MRKMSKAAKAEAYDGLADRLGLHELVLHDVAVGREPDAEVLRSEPDPDGDPETVHCLGRLYRATGGAGGIVVRVLWTSTYDARGRKVDDSSPDARVSTLDDMTRGIEGSGRSAAERALVECARELRAARTKAYEENRPSLGPVKLPRTGRGL